MKTQTNTRKLVECSLLIAIGVVLGALKIVDMPYGGSVTLASMLPVILISYRHGLGWGLGSGLVYAIVQQLLGLKNLFYGTSWQAVVAIILLDYIIAFVVCGLGGMFRKTIRNQALSLSCGALVVSILRYICHVISGATVWAGISIPTTAAMAYSIAYNATYMLPETIVLVLVAYYLGSVVDFSKDQPTRMFRNVQNKNADHMTVLATLVGVAAAIVDVTTVFAHLQDPETGDFNITLLKVENLFTSFWMSVLVITVLAAIVIAVLLVIRRNMLQQAQNENN